MPTKTINCYKCNSSFVPETAKQLKDSICKHCLKEIKESEEEQ